MNLHQEHGQSSIPESQTDADNLLPGSAEEALMQWFPKPFYQPTNINFRRPY